MAYATQNFRTKRAFRLAVESGIEIGVQSPGPFGAASNGTVAVEGPWYPDAHTWYATTEVRDGRVVKVR